MLLLDNVPSHIQGLELSNVNIHFPDPLTNTTSVLQPLDLGIIRNVKCHYSTRILCAVLTVQKCFANAGAITEQDSKFTDEDDIPQAHLLADVIVQVNINQQMSADSYKDIDNNIPITEKLPGSRYKTGMFALTKDCPQM